MTVAQSTKVRPVRKPSKPYASFPLFPHTTGRWAKKVAGKMWFYGRWGRKQGPEIVPVEDVEASAAEAKIEFDRCWPYHSKGLDAPAKDEGLAPTMRDLCNQFLASKQNRVKTGELSLHSFAEYRRTTDTLIEHFGKQCRLDSLRPADFEKFRAELAEGVNIVTLKSKINRCRVVLNYAYENLIDRPIKFGGAFDRPSDNAMKRARHKNRQDHGKRMFEADELRKLIDAADPTMKAMILLAANCGYGNTDLATIPRSAIDLKAGWADYARVKTGMPRRAPLWPETIEAVKKALESRPEPKDAADEELCFLTSRGTRFVRIQASKKTKDHYVTINTLSRSFELLMDRAGVADRKGRSFYAIRHGFETIAGDTGDQVATDAIMGHSDPSSAGEYREDVFNKRLEKVVNHVRKWLFPTKRKPK